LFVCIERNATTQKKIGEVTIAKEKYADRISAWFSHFHWLLTLSLSLSLSLSFLLFTHFILLCWKLISQRVI